MTSSLLAQAYHSNSSDRGDHESTPGHESGVLHMKARRRFVPTPRLCSSLQKAGVVVRSIAAGAAHTLAVGSRGELLSSGYNDKGQLGLGTRMNRGQ